MDYKELLGIAPTHFYAVSVSLLNEVYVRQ